jgi:hypothetical protein
LDILLTKYLQDEKTQLTPSQNKKSLNFTNHHLYPLPTLAGVDIEGMLGFLVGSFCVVFRGQVTRRSISIPVGAGCAPLLADLFLYSCEVEFVQKLLRKNSKKLVVSFNHIREDPS